MGSGGVSSRSEADRNEVEAAFTNGILDITMSKAESDQSKHIQIEG